MTYTFRGFTSVIHESSYIHPQSTVTGNVVIGKHCYIGPGAGIRGDWERSLSKTIAKTAARHLYSSNDQ